LPGTASDEKSIYLCDVLIHRPFLRGGVLADGPLRCLADPGPNGRIELCLAIES
jgi:hypothetical protein